MGSDWKYGNNTWSIEGEFIIDESSGNVLDIVGGAFKNNPVILYSKHGGAHQRFKMESQDGITGWVKIKNPGSGLCLQSSENGIELTVEGNY